MSIEQRIKDLERLLALKNAYQSATITFPKGIKLPDDVREEVVNKIKEYTLAMAEGQEAVPAAPTASSPFSETEITALKGLAEAVLSKAKPQTTVNGTNQIKPASPQTIESITQYATVLTTDSVEKSMRSKVASEDKVLVVKKDEQYAIVRTTAGAQFRILLEDLEIQ